MKQNENRTGFRNLEQNIIDVIKESQIKLGYAYGEMQLYYPLGSLNHTFHTELKTEEMDEYLKQFEAFVQERLGKVEHSNRGERFELKISAEGVKYVHEKVQTSEFLVDLVQVTGRFDCTKEKILDVFYKYSKDIIIKEMDNGEFDYLIHFQDDRIDNYIYCFHKEGERIIYHRYQKADYEEFGF